MGQDVVSEKLLTLKAVDIATFSSPPSGDLGGVKLNNVENYLFLEYLWLGLVTVA